MDSFLRPLTEKVPGLPLIPSVAAGVSLARVEETFAALPSLCVPFLARLETALASPRGTLLSLEGLSPDERRVGELLNGLLEQAARCERSDIALKEEVRRKTAELTKRNRRLRKIALFDPLTGAYNRRYFFKRLEEEFLRSARYGGHFSLLFIDIDNLKRINDSMGHVVGDRVIKGLSRVMKDSGRRGDVVARLGGDEFGYLLLGADGEGARQFAGRLRERFKRLSAKGLRLEPTASFGIAYSGCRAFRDFRELYRAADTALHAAKQTRDSISLSAPGSPDGRFQQLSLID